MNMKHVRKVSMIVNAVILFLVFALSEFFRHYGIKFMYVFSLPTALVYIIGFILIWYEKLGIYVWIVYFWLTTYMCCATVCLGYGYGFHLYCFSMIPILFVTEYLSYKLQHRRMPARYISYAIAAVYLLTTGLTAYYGPVYSIEQNISALFWVFNAMCVFGFLIYYSSYLIRNVVQSEQKLTEMAHNDSLTGLYNRHYMLDCLKDETENGTSGFLAISDIDDFKKINDRYGHNAGDAVLRTVAERMKKSCPDCLIGRWGGEEFLFYSQKSFADGKQIMEQVRQTIAAEPVVFEEQSIPVTLTVGISERQPEASIDTWIQDADSKLYIGKKNGKNQIVA